MINPELVSYVKKVVDMGFSQVQIEKAMLEKGYEKEDVENLIKGVLSKKKKIDLFQKKVVDLGHEDILKKATPHVVSYIKKELERGYFRDQIERTLVGEGYDKNMIVKLVNILSRKHEKGKIFESLTEKISHLEIFHFSKPWIKYFGIALVLLAIFTSLFYFTNKTFSLFLMKAISFIIAVPITAFFMHHISLKSIEIKYSESLRLIAIFGVIIFLVEIFSKSWLTLIALAIIFYLFIHIVTKNYGFGRKNAILLALGVFITGAILIYLVLILLGFISGVYGVLR